MRASPGGSSDSATLPPDDTAGGVARVSRPKKNPDAMPTSGVSIAPAKVGRKRSSDADDRDRRSLSGPRHAARLRGGRPSLLGLDQRTRAQRAGSLRSFERTWVHAMGFRRKRRCVGGVVRAGDAARVLRASAERARRSPRHAPPRGARAPGVPGIWRGPANRPGRGYHLGPRHPGHSCFRAFFFAATIPLVGLRPPPLHCTRLLCRSTVCDFSLPPGPRSLAPHSRHAENGAMAASAATPSLMFDMEVRKRASGRPARRPRSPIASFGSARRLGRRAYPKRVPATCLRPAARRHLPPPLPPLPPPFGFRAA